MTTSPQIEDYLHWLASQIRDEDDGNRGRTYSDLCTIMFEKEFVWVMPFEKDNNRLQDGKELRSEFCHVHGFHYNALEGIGPCSFLECLIGLSRRLEFNAGGSARGWSWSLLNNLELHRMWDPVTRAKKRKIDHILDRCIWRNYEPTGQGGFFPLAWSEEDQTKVEIWYQMHAYILELPEL